MMSYLWRAQHKKLRYFVAASWEKRVPFSQHLRVPFPCQQILSYHIVSGLSLSLPFPCTFGDCTDGTKEERFNVDVKGLRPITGKTQPLSSTCANIYIPCVRSWLGGREGIIPIPSKARGIGPFCASLSLTRKWTDGHMNKPLEPRPKVRLHPDLMLTNYTYV